MASHPGGPALDLHTYSHHSQSRAPLPAPGSALDLHTHSHHSKDSRCPVERLVRAAREKGLRGLGLTDHDTVAGHGELAELAREQADLLLIPGCEISTRAGHLLAYGVTEAPPRGRPLMETVKAVLDQGGVAVLAHPYRYGNGVSARMVLACEGVAVETLNGRSYQPMNRRAGRLARELSRAMTGGSDAHRHQEVGHGLTLFPAAVNTVEEALEALRQGQVSPGGKGLGLWAHGRSKARGLRRHIRRRLDGGPGRDKAPSEKEAP